MDVGLISNTILYSPKQSTGTLPSSSTLTNSKSKPKEKDLNSSSIDANGNSHANSHAHGTGKVASSTSNFGATNSNDKKTQSVQNPTLNWNFHKIKLKRDFLYLSHLEEITRFCKKSKFLFAFVEKETQFSIESVVEQDQVFLLNDNVQECDAFFLIIFCSKLDEKQACLPEIPEQLLYDLEGWTEGELNLSESLKPLNNSFYISEKYRELTQERTFLMNALIRSLHNWFEDILRMRGWIRFGFLYVWSLENEPQIYDHAQFMEWLSQKSRNLNSRASPKNAPSTQKIAPFKKRRCVSVNNTHVSKPFALDLGISLCPGRGIVLNPVSRIFYFEKLAARHFDIASDIPSSVFVAPTGTQATLRRPCDAFMDAVIILIKGKKMPVTYPAELIFVPLYSPTKPSYPTLDKKNAFWNEIDDSIAFLSGPEANMANNDNDRLGRSSNLSAHGVNLISKKEVGRGGSPKSLDGKSSLDKSKSSLKSEGFDASLQHGRARSESATGLKSKPAPVDSDNSHTDLEMYTNLPIDANFHSQNFDGLALDLVDDDDFDFFEQKDQAGGPLQETPAAEILTPAPGSLGHSPATTGNTPFPDQPTTPFVFSPPAVLMNDLSSPAPAPYSDMRSTGITSHSPSKSTPVTPHTFSQSPMTTPGYDTPGTVAPFFVEAKVLSSPKGQKSSPDNQNSAKISIVKDCPPSWLPFDFEVVLQKSEFGGGGKWSWNPAGSSDSGTAKFDLRRYKSGKKKIHQSERIGDVFPPLSQEQLCLLLPFSTDYVPVLKSDISSSLFLISDNDNRPIAFDEWKRASFYQFINQAYLFDSDSVPAGSTNSMKPLSFELWKSLDRICCEGFFGIPKNENSSTALLEYLKVDDDEESNFAVYETIKLRKKKTKPDQILDILPQNHVLVLHNSAQIVCNSEVLRFWSKCRIAPISGPKNVRWISIFPEVDSLILTQRIESYMSQFESTWDLLSFGVFEPCPLRDKEIPGFVPVPIDANHEHSYHHLIAYYYQILPTIAEDIIAQIVTGPPTQYCLVILWNPFPYAGEMAAFDFCCIFSQLLYLIQQTTLLPLAYLKCRIYFEGAHTKQMLGILSRTEDSMLNLEKRAFTTYNRIRKLLSQDVSIYAPAFTIENPQLAPKFSLEIPKLSSPLLLFEPDRIIYLFYGTSATHCFAIWSDAFGEFRYEEWLVNFESAGQMVDSLLEQTFGYLSRSFVPRLVVCCVNGWSTTSLSAWKMAVHIQSDFEEGGSEKSGGNGEEVVGGEASNASTPGLTPKIYPATPGSAYTTPQPERNKKAIHEGPKILPILGSLSLISLEYSRLGVYSDTLKSMPHAAGSEHWVLKESSVLFTPSNRIVPWAMNEIPALAKSWILEQKTRNKDCQGVECSLIWHWQTEYATTCFNHWYESGNGKRSNIIRDIMIGLYRQRITNEREEWLFEVVSKQIFIALKLE